MPEGTGLGTAEVGPAELRSAPVAAPGARPVPWRSVGVVASLVAGVALAGVRVEPQVWGDPGVWLSVGARLLDGDRLYADVFDNKDPFFFYSYAAALWAGGVRGPFVLEVVWLGVATGGMALALRALRVGTAAMLAGALVYPFALTAAWYVPGATMVPALALAPLALWLWVRGSTSASGALVVVSMLFKLNLGLVVAAPLLALLALGGDGVSRRRRALEGLGGAGVALLLTAIVLAVRGELHPYLDLIAYNVHYSDAGVHGGGVGAHLHVVRELFAAAGKWQLPAAELAAVVLLLTALVGWVRLGQTFRRVSAVAVAAFAAAMVTLAATAIFVVHLQMLAYPAALGAAMLVLVAKHVWKPFAALAAAGFVVFAVRSSLELEDLSRWTTGAWTTAPVSTPGHTLESARLVAFPGSERVTYAVLGRNTEDGHAAFVDGTMDLRCRYFHQYPFYRQDQLDETIDCVRHEEPMLVLVTTSLYDPMRGQPRWEAFVAEARAVLASRYRLVSEAGMSQVWKRR
ncbi:MAG: hypothetical protein M5U27_09260 [Gaiella sp.]|nr:hypothetical protein [Gaiella sp.]